MFLGTDSYKYFPKWTLRNHDIEFPIKSGTFDQMTVLESPRRILVLKGLVASSVCICLEMCEGDN